MNTSFLFYDLETSGISPKEARIMQFAGQRTTMQLEPIGEPFNYLIKMTEDTLPEPDAVLLTGITPQATIADGITEAEFLKIFSTEIATAGTIFIGFNSVRFDDEFMRYLQYRNFYDAYEWTWSNNRSRWDLLDVVRMTRALRPDGITWPVDSAGAATNRLELLTSVNGLLHEAAHDALSDVQATIALAKLIQTKQPKLFNFLLDHRGKKEIEALVTAGQPFVYTSGKYKTEHDKTTVVARLCDHPKRGGSLVFDLRHDPTPYLSMKAEELAKLWKHYCKEYPCPHDRLPVKSLQYNRCPAVAPLGVLDEASQKRLDIDLAVTTANLAKLKNQSNFTNELKKALEIMDTAYQTQLVGDALDVDGQLYEGFVGDGDKRVMAELRNQDQSELVNFEPHFSDERLKNLFPLYKARNFPKLLNDEERGFWEAFCAQKLTKGKASSRAAKYFERLATLAERTDLTGQQTYLLEELQLYGQSILPAEE